MLMQAVFAGALAGLASSAHCAAMCGPLCAASCRGSAAASAAGTLRYQLGRTLSYAFAGSVAGQLGALLERSWLVATSPLLVSLGAAAALLLLAARLWRPQRPRMGLVQLGRSASGTGAFARLLALVPREPAVFGTLSVLLPCGALAAALLLAATTGARLPGALLMVGFALTSGIGVIAGGALLSRLTAIASQRLARGLAIALTAAAIALCVRPLLQVASADNQEQPASCH
jgi:sulfite exporter TauE/SafE